MPATKTPRIIVVIGATGNQGGGVARALLASDQGWHVRASTQDVTSSRAKAFIDECSSYVDAGRLTLVQGNVYDPSSLQSAFSGAYGVFAITSHGYAGRVLVNEGEMTHEIEAGRNMVMAAKECGVEHLRGVTSLIPGTCARRIARMALDSVFDGNHCLCRFLLHEPEVASVQPTPV